MIDETSHFDRALVPNINYSTWADQVKKDLPYKSPFLVLDPIFRWTDIDREGPATKHGSRLAGAGFSRVCFLSIGFLLGSLSG